MSKNYEEITMWMWIFCLTIEQKYLKSRTSIELEVAKISQRNVIIKSSKIQK